MDTSLDYGDNEVKPASGLDSSIQDVLLQAINGAANSTVTKRQRRGNRMKVYDNGFIFTYDKDSQCGQRSFWRCERKSECPARVHTNPSTNQIIKRINDHTHEPPSRDELPPWLLLNQTEPEMGEKETTPTNNNLPPPGSGTTGVLLPYSSGSVNLQLSALIERELEADKGPMIITAKQEPLEDEPSGSNRKRRRVSFSNHDEPEQFWELYDVTKRTMAWLKRGAGTSSPSRSPSLPGPAVCDSRVAEHLDSHGLGCYRDTFSRYSLPSLLRLSSADCAAACGNSADGILLYHSLRNEGGSVSPPSSSCLTVFVAGPEEADEPVYQMISLTNRTQIELRDHLHSRGLLPRDSDNRLCVSGPAGINVELADQIIAGWSNESVFRLSISKGVCKLTKVIS